MREINVQQITDVVEKLCIDANTTMDFSQEELLAKCQEKREQRGGFSGRQFLISKE